MVALEDTLALGAIRQRRGSFQETSVMNSYDAVAVVSIMVGLQEFRASNSEDGCLRFAVACFFPKRSLRSGGVRRAIHQLDGRLFLSLV